MEKIIFIVMAVMILLLMFDNRRLEKLSRMAIRAAVKEEQKRKLLEVMMYGEELDDNSFLDDEDINED